LAAFLTFSNARASNLPDAFTRYVELFRKVFERQRFVDQMSGFEDTAFAAVQNLGRGNLSRSELPEDPSEPGSARGAQSGLSAFLYDWRYQIITTYGLENGAAGDGDNWDHSLFAIRAAPCSVDEILPSFHP
jgi:hypothetical protein